jgi:hypothetical protein
MTAPAKDFSASVNDLIHPGRLKTKNNRRMERQLWDKIFFMVKFNRMVKLKKNNPEKKPYPKNILMRTKKKYRNDTRP